MSALPVVIIGAGAAGTMAAIHAAGRGVRVVLLERTRDGGRKILIAGGGRCNVLPSVLDERRFVTDSSPNTLRNMLRAWPLAEQVRFFEDEVGLPLEREEETGKLFPASHRARDVRDGLIALARRRGVELAFGAMVRGLEPRAEGGWRVLLEGAAPIEASRVVVATGGLSVPTTGSDGTGLRLLEALGHVMHPTYPALTPLTHDPPRHGGLSGVSLRVQLAATVDGRRFETTGGFLFTHRGYSGPAVLDASHLAVRARMEGRAQVIAVRWVPALDADAWTARLAPAAAQVGTVLRRELPERLAQQLCDEAQVPAETQLAQLLREARRRLVAALTAYELPWTGDEGYRKAEVTGGGVALSEVHPRTLESRRCPGLYLCGEVLDAFGPIGGYNFYWAWATGRSAGEGVGG